MWKWFACLCAKKRAFWHHLKGSSEEKVGEMGILAENVIEKSHEKKENLGEKTFGDWGWKKAR